MYYCQRCDRKIATEATHCPYCGVLQERDLAGEKKPCRKCEKQIPVNSNYCPYCGHDQAIFEYKETPKEEPEAPETENEQSRLETDATELTDLIEQIRQENARMLQEKQQKEEALRAKLQLPRNESKRPGLITSTKLMLKDCFKTDKRMGRADFWYGLLGSYLLFLSVITCGFLLIDTLRASLTFDRASVLSFFSFICMTFWLLVVLTALTRRFHDAEIPLIYLLLLLTGVGEIICLLLALKPQAITNERYTFKSRDKRRK